MNKQLVYQQNEGPNVAYTWQDRQNVLRWHVGSNMTNKGDIESNQAVNVNGCITDMNKFKLRTSPHHPTHIFDDQIQVWHPDPALRIGQVSHQL